MFRVDLYGSDGISHRLQTEVGIAQHLLNCIADIQGEQDAAADRDGVAP